MSLPLLYGQSPLKLVTFQYLLLSQPPPPHPINVRWSKTNSAFVTNYEPIFVSWIVPNDRKYMYNKN